MGALNGGISNKGNVYVCNFSYRFTLWYHSLRLFWWAFEAIRGWTRGCWDHCWVLTYWMLSCSWELDGCKLKFHILSRKKVLFPFWFRTAGCCYAQVNGIFFKILILSSLSNNILHYTYISPFFAKSKNIVLVFQGGVR